MNRFGIRAVLALMAGIACVAFIVSYMIRNDSDPSDILALLIWAPFTFAGLLVAARYGRSLLMGSLLGSTLAVCVYFCGLLFTNAFGTASLQQAAFLLAWLWILAAAGAGVLALIIGGISSGFTLNRSNKTSKQWR